MNQTKPVLMSLEQAAAWWETMNAELRADGIDSELAAKCRAAKLKMVDLIEYSAEQRLAFQQRANALPTPYCTRGQAAAWIGASVETVDRMLVPMAPRRPLANDSKYPPLRYVKLWAGQIRIVTADVLAELPEPEVQPRMDTDEHGLKRTPQRQVALSV